MKIRNNKMKISALAFAVNGALLAMSAMPAYAEDDAATLALKTATNYVEIGGDYVSASSPKFGEYNGKDKKGTHETTNFGIRGGDAYGSPTGTHRMEVIGKDIGTTSSNISTTISDQGKWEANFVYDELQHNTATGYQTPYVGQMGGNSFMLPGGFGGVRVLQNTTASATTGALTLQGDGAVYVKPAGNITATTYTQNSTAVDSNGVTITTLGAINAYLASINTVSSAIAKGVPTNLLNGTLGLTANQLGAFQNVDINNTRKNTTFNAKVFLTPDVKATFDYNHLRQTGAKLQGIGFDGGLDTAAGLVKTALASTAGNEKIAILPMPNNFSVDTFNIGLNWASEKATLTASYYASIFKDIYKSASFQSFWIPAPASYQAGSLVDNLNLYSLPVDTLTTPPDNKLHQFNLLGSYNLSKETKVSGGFSYGRNTQNASFVPSELSYAGNGIAAPTSSDTLNGVIVTTHADLKLTNQTNKDLKLAAGFKYDKRSNQTESKLYDYSSIGWGGLAAPTHERLTPSTPLSYSKTQVEIAADLRLNATRDVRFAFTNEKVKRWCDSYATTTQLIGLATVTAGSMPSAATGNNYFPGGNCVVAPEQKENRLSADYRARVNDDVNVRAGYAYANRTTTFDTNARTEIGIINNNAIGIVAHQNAGDTLGFHAALAAPRKQNMLKGTVNWQVNDQLAVALNGRYVNDKYDTTYGLQKADFTSLSVDASYAYSDTGSITPYLTQQNRSRDMQSAAVPNATAVAVVAVAPGTVTSVNTLYPAYGTVSSGVIGLPAGAYVWSNSLKDKDLTIGINIKQSDLLSGKLEVKGDLTYTRGQVNYDTEYVTAGAGQYCSAPSLKQCGALPSIINNQLTLKLTGDYKLDKQEKITTAYQFQRLKTSDYYYNGYQTGNTPNSVLPDNQQSGAYNLYVIAATYTYSFR